MMSLEQINKMIIEKEDELRNLYCDRDLILRENRIKESEQYKKRKKSLDETGKILYDKKLLNEGDFVKVTGSRTSPYRKIKTISNYSIIGKVVEKNRRTGEMKVNPGKVTTTGLNKITHIFKDGEYVKIQEYIEGETK